MTPSEVATSFLNEKTGNPKDAIQCCMRMLRSSADTETTERMRLEKLVAAAVPVGRCLANVAETLSTG
jgi:hypothetical protein